MMDTDFNKVIELQFQPIDTVPQSQKEYDYNIKQQFGIDQFKTREDVSKDLNSIYEQDYDKATEYNLISVVPENFENFARTVTSISKLKRYNPEISYEAIAAGEITDEQLARSSLFRTNSILGNDSDSIYTKAFYARAKAQEAFNNQTEGLGRKIFKRAAVPAIIGGSLTGISYAFGGKIGAVVTSPVTTFLAEGGIAYYDSARLGTSIYNFQKYYSNRIGNLIMDENVSPAEFATQFDSILNEVLQAPEEYVSELLQGSILETPDIFADGGNTLAGVGMSTYMNVVKGISRTGAYTTSKLIPNAIKRGVNKIVGEKGIQTVDENLTSKIKKTYSNKVDDVTIDTNISEKVATEAPDDTTTTLYDVVKGVEKDKHKDRFLDLNSSIDNGIFDTDTYHINVYLGKGSNNQYSFAQPKIPAGWRDQPFIEVTSASPVSFTQAEYRPLTGLGEMTGSKPGTYFSTNINDTSYLLDNYVRNIEHHPTVIDRLKKRGFDLSRSYLELPIHYEKDFNILGSIDEALKDTSKFSDLETAHLEEVKRLIESGKVQLPVIEHVQVPNPELNKEHYLFRGDVSQNRPLDRTDVNVLNKVKKAFSINKDVDIDEDFIIRSMLDNEYYSNLKEISGNNLDELADLHKAKWLLENKRYRKYLTDKDFDYGSVSSFSYLPVEDIGFNNPVKFNKQQMNKDWGYAWQKDLSDLDIYGIVGPNEINMVDLTKVSKVTKETSFDSYGVNVQKLFDKGVGIVYNPDENGYMYIQAISKNQEDWNKPFIIKGFKLQ